LLPGVAEICQQWQKLGIKIGVTTGFTRSMLDLLLAGAATQGFVPDTHCAGDEVEMPRPTAYMVIKNLERMGVYNLENAMLRTIKVDDTVSGAGEGAPLCWRVGVSKWSNYVADSWDAVRKMSAAQLAACEQASKEKLVKESGAHYVIDDLRDMPAVIADVNQRLDGLTPHIHIGIGQIRLDLGNDFRSTAFAVFAYSLGARLSVVRGRSGVLGGWLGEQSHNRECQG